MILNKSKKLYKIFFKIIFIGVEDDIALRVLNSKHPLVVSNADDIKVTILVKDNPRTFIFGEELPYTLSTGQDVVTVASRDGGTLTFNTYLAENPETTEVRVLELIDDELVSTSTNHLGVKAVNRYKKVS